MTAFLAFRLFRERKTRWWAMAFAGASAAAFVGGTYHGFPAFLHDELWAATELCAGLASFAMVVAAAEGTGIAKAFFFWFAVAKFAVYVAFTSQSDDFLYIVIDSGIALLIVAVLHALRASAARPWMLGAVTVSVVAALVQALHLAPHPHFNHNDLYHVIQIAAMVLFYRGAKRL